MFDGLIQTDLYCLALRLKHQVRMEEGLGALQGGRHSEHVSGCLLDNGTIEATKKAALSLVGSKNS